MIFKLCGIFLFLPSLAIAQVPTQTIRGQVTDAESASPLAGATVVIVTLSPAKGSLSDGNGNYKITEVPVGRHTVRINLPGYEERVIPEILLGSGKEVILNIELSPSLIESSVDTVIISGKENHDKPLNEMAVVSARSFSLEETKRYAASVNDPARMASAFAGVNNGNDESNEIIIRGNSPRGLLWRLEGIEIPNPNHFSPEGASGGGVSILSANLLDQSDFFTGAFPAEYGNALSGVFDLQLRKGNEQQREYAAQIGVLGLDFAMEGPIGKSVYEKQKALQRHKRDSSKVKFDGLMPSYLINYRYSTLTVLKLIGLNVAGNAVPGYQDFSWRLHLPTQKFGVFSFFGISGLSSVNDEAKRDSTKWDTEADRRDEIFSSDMGIAGLSHIIFFGNNTYLKSIFSTSGSRVKYNEARVEDDYSTTPYYKEQYLSTANRASFLLNRKLSVRHTVRAGLIFGQLGYNFSVERKLTDSTALEKIIQRNGGSQQWQAFGQWKFRLSEKFQFLAGVHYLFFSMNADHSVEPRAGLKWTLDSKTTISLGTGIHSRLEPMSTYLGERKLSNGQIEQPNREIRFTRALHFVLGLDRVLLKDLHTKIELYYQHMFLVPVTDTVSSYSTLNYESNLIDYKLANTGSGRNFGVDITVQKYLTQNWYFLGTGSVYASRYTGSDGIERGTRFNGGHILNLLAGREFHVGKKNDKSNLLSADLRMVWSGGQRYTPVDLPASQQAGYAIYQDHLRYSVQARDFLRLDIRVAYRKNRPKSSHILSLDIRNVTNRKNVYRDVYNPETQNIETSYQLGIIPVLNYRVEF